MLNNLVNSMHGSTNSVIEKGLKSGGSLNNPVLRNFALRLARVQFYDYEKNLVYAEYMDQPGHAYGMKPASPVSGNRSQMTAGFETGDMIVVGNLAASGTFGEPIVLARLPSSQATGKKFEATRGDYTNSEKKERRRSRGKKTYPGELVTTSSAGAELTLGKGASLGDKNLNKIKIDSDENTIINSSINSVSVTDAGKTHTGMIIRDNNLAKTTTLSPKGVDPYNFDKQKIVLPNHKELHIRTLRGDFNIDDKYQGEPDCVPLVEHRTQIRELGDAMPPLHRELHKIDFCELDIGRAKPPMDRWDLGGEYIPEDSVEDINAPVKDPLPLQSILRTPDIDFSFTDQGVGSTVFAPITDLLDEIWDLKSAPPVFVPITRIETIKQIETQHPVIDPMIDNYLNDNEFPIPPLPFDASEFKRKGYIIETVSGTHVGFNPFDEDRYGRPLIPMIYDWKDSPVFSRYLTIPNINEIPALEEEENDHTEIRWFTSAYMWKMPWEYSQTRISITKEGYTNILLGCTWEIEDCPFSPKREHWMGSGRSLEFYSCGSIKATVDKNRDEEESIILDTIGQVRFHFGADDGVPSFDRRDNKTIYSNESTRELITGVRRPYLTPGNQEGDYIDKTKAESVSVMGTTDGGIVLRVGAAHPDRKRKFHVNGFTSTGMKRDVSNGDVRDEIRMTYQEGDGPYAYHDIPTIGNTGYRPYVWAGPAKPNKDIGGHSLDAHFVSDIFTRIGKDSTSGVSWTVDAGGGLVTHFGKDKAGQRSWTCSMDGGINWTVLKGDANENALSWHLGGRERVSVLKDSWKYFYEGQREYINKDREVSIQGSEIVYIEENRKEAVGGENYQLSGLDTITESKAKIVLKSDSDTVVTSQTALKIKTPDIWLDGYVYLGNPQENVEATTEFELNEFDAPPAATDISIGLPDHKILIGIDPPKEIVYPDDDFNSPYYEPTKFEAPSPIPDNQVIIPPSSSNQDLELVKMHGKPTFTAPKQPPSYFTPKEIFFSNNGHGDAKLNVKRNTNIEGQVTVLGNQVLYSPSIFHFGHMYVFPAVAPPTIISHSNPLQNFEGGFNINEIVAEEITAIPQPYTQEEIIAQTPVMAITKDEISIFDKGKGVAKKVYKFAKDHVEAFEGAQHVTEDATKFYGQVQTISKMGVIGMCSNAHVLTAGAASLAGGIFTAAAGFGVSIPGASFVMGAIATADKYAKFAQDAVEFGEKAAEFAGDAVKLGKGFVAVADGKMSIGQLGSEVARFSQEAATFGHTGEEYFMKVSSSDTVIGKALSGPAMQVSDAFMVMGWAGDDMVKMTSGSLKLGSVGGVAANVDITGNISIKSDPSAKTKIGGNVDLGESTADNINLGGTIYAQNAKGDTGAVLTKQSGGGVSWDIFGASDIKWKDIIKPLKQESILDKIKKIDAYYYTWNAKYIERYSGSANKVNVGLIAQEIENLVPEVIGNYYVDQIEYKTVEYDKLVCYLIECVKELNSKIEVLEKKVNVV